MTQLRIDKVRLDGGTQMRVGPRNGETLEDYKQAIREGATLPPIVVFWDGKEYWLADGFHRWSAHKELALDHIEADVKEGSKRDAILYAVGANASHGLRRSNADKRRAVETLLKDEEWGQWSDREIARQCSVDHKTVGRIRQKLTGDFPSDNSRTYITRHGTQATMKTANIGRSDQLPESSGEVQQAICGNSADTACAVQRGGTYKVGTSKIGRSEQPPEDSGGLLPNNVIDTPPESTPSPDTVNPQVAPVEQNCEAAPPLRAEDFYIPFHDGSQPQPTNAESEKRLRDMHNALERLLKLEHGSGGLLSAPDAYTQSVRQLVWHARDMLDDWLSESNASEHDSRTITVEALN